MAIFSAIIAMLPAGAAWGPVTIAGLSPAISAAVIAVGRGALWALAGSALSKPKIPRQQVQATLSQTDAPRIRAYGRNLLGGQRAFFEAKGGRLHQMVAAHHGRVNGLVRFWMDGEPVETGDHGPQVDGGGRVNRYLTLMFKDGSRPGGDYAGCFDPSVSGLALDWKDLHEEFPTLWTSAHRLDEQATFYAVFGDPADEDFTKFFPKGAYTQIQAEIEGALVRNLSGTLVYSENAGLCIRDLMTHSDGWNIDSARLDTASWSSFVALCNQPVSLAAGGTEPRYRLCGFYTLDDPLKDVTARMLATCDGQIYETPEGTVGILGGAWSEPDVTITADDILSIEMQDGFDPFTDYNVLKGSFISPDHAYQPTEVAELRDEAALATQEERVEQFDNEMVPSHSQLQRLMKIRFAKDRRALQGVIRTNLVGLKARFPKGDGIHTIRIVAEEFGLDGVFEVTSHMFSVPDGYCEIGVASIVNPYGWNAATEEKPLPPGIEDLEIPDRSLPDFQDVTLVQEVVQVTGGVQGVRVAVTVKDPGRGDLDLRAQIAKGTYSAEGPWPDPQPSWVEMAADRYRAESGILDDGETYTVRIRWKRGGTWVLAGTVTANANPARPEAPTAFSGTPTSFTVQLSWVNAASNFHRTQIRWNTTNDFASATAIATLAGSAGNPGAYTHESPALGVNVYWAVTISPSNVASQPAGPLTISV
ncbi:hypothetical protein F8A10_07665 [Paracoccus kondratievae]|uniref:hypothetical protein n=1 Tax=Paracoccus kondratievae TaxID=135740 RepID=UPI0012665232|nr:hypothetical protein [Paracoccus kondratievae]QFQ87310.1 hypothetical protein F8A10_07665 [Paracoccus kondratievae]